MRTSIQRIGNSQGVIIPKPLLAQVDFNGELDMSVEGGAIVLRKPKATVRAGWAEDSMAIVAAGDDGLAWPEFGNAGDDQLTW